MIYVYAKKVSSDDRSRLMKIFGLLKYQESEIRIIDVEHEDVDCTDQEAIVTLEKETYKAVVKWFTSRNIYTPAQLLGNNIKDPDCKFLWYNFNHNVTEVMTDETVKAKVWSGLLEQRHLYVEYGHAPPKEAQPTITAEEEAVVDEVITAITSDAPAVIVEPEILVETINEVDAKVTETSKGLTIDVNDFMSKVAESIDLSDPTLGKSLSLSEKIELNVPNVGKVFIYPTGDRIKATDTKSAHLSFKDTLGLIRISNIFGADSITFHLKEANV